MKTPRLSIRTRLATGGCAIIAVLIVTATAARRSLLEIDREHEANVRRALAVSGPLFRVHDHAMRAVVVAQAELAAEQEPARSIELAVVTDSLRTILMGAGTLTLGEREHLERFGEVFDQLIARLGAAHAFRVAGETEAAREVAQDAVGTLDTLVLVSASLQAAQTARSQGLLALVQGRRDQGQRILAMLFLVAALVVTAVILLAWRGIVRPLDALASQADRYGRGDWQPRETPDAHPSEFTPLVLALNRAFTAVADRNSELAGVVQVAWKTHNAMAIGDPEGRVEWANEGYLRTGGGTGPSAAAAGELNLLTAWETPGNASLLRDAIARRATAVVEERRVGADGQEYWVAATLTPVVDEEGSLVKLVVVETDITRRVRAEAQLRGALHERTLLLAELHHRVKNNLQIISSILSLTARKTDGPARGLLRDVQARVQAMGLVHSGLNAAAGEDCIEFGSYLVRLAEGVARSFAEAEPGRIRIVVDAGDVWLDAETAVPLGLVTNELLYNAYRHAFSPDGPGGSIRLSLSSEEQGHVLVVADDGRGFDPQPEGAASTGMALVRNLVKQLGGTDQLDSGRGVRWTIRIPTRDARSARAGREEEGMV